MAEDLDEKARRVRELLNSFYKSDDSDSSDPVSSIGRRSFTRRDTLQQIDTKSFDPERYMNSLLRRTGLENLLKKHVEMAAEIKNLDSDMQMLVYENYNKFISATDTIRRMKDNVSGMESNMEQLLEKVTAVRAKSDGVNASLFERRERIEELNGTRSLLRKVQFVFDLPKRLWKCIKSENYADAVKAYVGALPVLKAYGASSFQTCREECEEAMATINRRLQARVMTGSEPLNARAEAVVLLEKLGYPVEDLMEGFLLTNMERLLAALQSAEGKRTGHEASSDEKVLVEEPVRELLEQLEKDFISDFAQTAAVFQAMFPTGGQRLTKAAKDLFNKYFSNVQQSLEPTTEEPTARELVDSLKILSADVAKMHEVLPEAGLHECAAKAVESAVKNHVQRTFSKLDNHIKASLKLSQIDSQSALQASFFTLKGVIVDGSINVLKDLKELLDDSVDLLVTWRDIYIDLVQGGFQDLFSSLADHFILLSSNHGSAAMSSSSDPSSHMEINQGHLRGTTPASGVVLLLARASVFIEHDAVPKITEVIACSFTGGGARGKEERPAFVPSEICRSFRTLAERLLHQYINVQACKLSMLVCKSVTTPNWLQYKEPRDVRMFVDLLIQDIDSLISEVGQLLDPGMSKLHRRSDSAGSVGSVRSNTARDDRGHRLQISQRGRSRFLERDVAKLFKQRIEIFTKPDMTQVSVITCIIKIFLKSFQEYVRLETFSRAGFQQIQVDTQYLRDALKEKIEDEGAVDFLLDEVCAAAAERCVDPVPLEQVVLDKFVQSKRLKILEGTQ